MLSIGRQVGNDLPKIATKQVNLTNPISKNIQVENNFDNNKVAQNPTQGTIRKLKIDSFTPQIIESPELIINELGFDYDTRQIKNLLTAFDNEDAKNAFLEIASKEFLNEEDIYSAFMYIDENYSNNGVIDWLKDKAYKVATGKSRIENKANKIASNMNTVREIRGDEFKTDTVLNLGANMSKDENVKENILHFVETKGNGDEYLYSENNIVDATEYITQYPDDMENFMSNLLDLESIKDEFGQIKYTGDTNIQVGKAMTTNKELAPTIKIAAHKGDMNNEYLVNITNNLVINPNMVEPIEFSLLAKNENGTDKFTACDISNESTHLVTQTEEYCHSYAENLYTLSEYSNLDGSEIITITNNITSCPEIRNEVINLLESNTVSGEDIANHTTSYVNGTGSATINNKTETSPTIRQALPYGRIDANLIYQEKEPVCKENQQEKLLYNTNSDTKFQTTSNPLEKRDKMNENIKNEEEQSTKSKTEKRTVNVETEENHKKDNTNSDEKTNEIKQIKKELKVPIKSNKNIAPINWQDEKEKEINDEDYTIEIELKERLKRKFGAYSEEIFDAILKNPRNLQLVKQYENNPTILKTYLEKPELVDKIKTINVCLTNMELDEVLSLCDNNKSTEIMLKSLESVGTRNAIKITQKSKITNSEDDVLKILNDKTISCIIKKKKLDELFGIEDKKQYVA